MAHSLIAFRICMYFIIVGNWKKKKKSKYIKPMKMSSQQLTHRNRDQMTAIYRQRFQSHFLEWKSSYFDPNFKEMCSQWHIDIMCPLVQVMPWCRTGDKPLSEPTKAKFLRIFASLGLLVLIMSLVDETQIVIEIVFIMVFQIYIYIISLVTMVVT